MESITRFLLLGACCLALLLTSACAAAQAAPATAAIPAPATATRRSPAETATSIPPPTVLPTAPIFVPTSAPTPGPFLEPAGCKAPPDDYAHVQVNGQRLNQRTYAMLQHAAQLYGGPIDAANTAVTQGSYSNNGPASFGTHLGGGAVDISVIRPGGSKVLYNEIEPLIRALRAAGFAAWLRDRDEVNPGSGIHIHAIAIGDAELSPEAVEQLTGPYGYFRGYSGVPQPNGTPEPDRHGGPVICQWMREAGYADLRPEAARTYPATNWEATLREAARKFETAGVEETRQLAFQLDFRPGKNEDPSNMCGPLAAAILRDAGLLPAGYGPVSDIRAYWLDNPKRDGRPWTLFPPDDYDLFHFDTPINQFDFAAWPLRPADFLYTYQGRDGYEHMFIVTEVDAQGRAYSVTNHKQRDKTYIAQKILLYDPARPDLGVFKNDWVNSPFVGRTGLGGFDVLRRKGVSLPPGSRFTYTVRPGDTVQTIAAGYASTFEAIAAENQLPPPYSLTVGQSLAVPVNIAVTPAP